MVRYPRGVHISGETHCRPETSSHHHWWLILLVLVMALFLIGVGATGGWL
ncbi:MAG: hypothetical protein M3M98_03815 [Nitrospirota bacterium]|nr:hypothetical protein [Nitrospirota bacterium]